MFETLNTVIAGARVRLAAAVNDRRAISAVEYGVLAAFIAIAIIAAVTAVGANVIALFENLAEQLSGATGGGS